MQTGTKKVTYLDAVGFEVLARWSAEAGGRSRDVVVGVAAVFVLRGSFCDFNSSGCD